MYICICIYIYICIFIVSIIKIGLNINIHSFHRPQKHLMALTRHHQVRAATAQFLVQRVWDGAPVALIFVACHLFATRRFASVFVLVTNVRVQTSEQEKNIICYILGGMGGCLQHEAASM